MANKREREERITAPEIQNIILQKGTSNRLRLSVVIACQRDRETICEAMLSLAKVMSVFSSFVLAIFDIRHLRKAARSKSRIYIGCNRNSGTGADCGGKWTCRNHMWLKQRSNDDEAGRRSLLHGS